ncbi:MAG: hypothetical protein ACI4TX_03880 [Christensenellales bacterium]
MKKFLVFCVAIIVTVSLGFMVYYFTLNNEGVTVVDTSYEMNVGEVRAFKLNHINPKGDTKITFTYQDEGIVEFDLESLTVKAIGEGSTRVTLSTSNKDIPVTYIDVYVGGGSVENPFFIRNQDELSRIGKAEDVFKLSSNYKLVNDIALNVEWKPIASNGDSLPTEAFSGTFNGNNHTISNLNISTEKYAGLFAKVGASGQVYNLNVTNANISGECVYAGVITALNNGVIKNCAVSSATLSSSASGAYVGGIAGVNESATSIASIYKCVSNCSITSSATSDLGGIAGKNAGAEVSFCYADLDSSIIANDSSIAGGIVGFNTYTGSYASAVAGCYAIGNIEGGNAGNVGGIVGKNDYVSDVTVEKTNKIYGNYYLRSGYAKGCGNYNDEENASADPVNIDYGIYGVEGKTYDELCSQNTYKLLRDAKTNSVVAWDFSNVWTMQASGTPKLNIEGSYVSNGRSRLLSAGEINTPSALLNIKSGDVVEVSQDIDLGGMSWNPLSVSNVSLSGSEAFYEENGRYPKIFNFKLVNGESVGFFAVLDNSTVKNINFEQVSNVNNQFDVNSVAMGVIAGRVNENSTIENVGVSFDSLFVNVSSNLADNNIYVGGVAGINNGTIDNVSVTSGSIKVTFDSEVKANTYVGGVAGALLADANAVQNSSASNVNIDVANGNDGAIGGVVGLLTNSTRVVDCYVADCLIVASINYGEKSNGSLIGHYEGAIVGLANQGAKNSLVSGSTANNVKITGFVVGGVIGSTTGTVENCYTKVDLTGFKVGGVTGYQINSSNINNVRVDGKLSNSNISFDLGQVHSASAQKAGVACISYGNQNEIPKFENVFVNCTFNNDGKDSYKTTATIKDNSFMNRLGIKWIFSGEEKNIIVNTDKCGNAKTNEKANSFIDVIGNAISSTTFSIFETNENAMNRGNYDVFTSHNYTIDKWKFMAGYAPAVKNCVNSSVQNG